MGAGGSANMGLTGVTGIFWGSVKDAQKAMYDAGVLHSPKQSIAKCPFCGEFDNYYDAFLIESCTEWVTGTSYERLPSIFPDRPNISVSECFNPLFLHGDFAKMSSVKGPISNGASDLWRTWRMYTCRLLDPPSRETWKALFGKPRPECDFLFKNMPSFKNQLQEGDPNATRCFVQQLRDMRPSGNHLLGGKIAEQRPGDTAYYYRGKYAPVCFNLELPLNMVGKDGLLLDTPTVFDAPFKIESKAFNGLRVVPTILANAILLEIKERLDGVYSLLGRKNASVSYINYQAPPLANWQEAYFGGNAERLATTKASYDPLGVFSKPLIVDGIVPTTPK